MIPLHHRQFIDALRNADRSDAWRLLQRTTHAPPRFLYKYLSPTSQGIRSLIVQSQIWLASPGSFNDPFEMAVRLTFEGRPSEKIRALRAMSKATELPWKKRQQLAQKFYAIDPTEKMNQSQRRLVELFGVGCLSAAGPRNTLMWSHYADSHRGVCVQFHLPSSPVELVHAFPVNYSDEYPVINWVKRHKVESKLGEVLWQKSNAWSYEKEHRIVERERANSLYDLNPLGVSGLVLGARASPDVEGEVVALLRQRRLAGKPKVRVFRARLSESQYSVRIVRARDIETQSEL